LFCCYSAVEERTTPNQLGKGTQSNRKYPIFDFEAAGISSNSYSSSGRRNRRRRRRRRRRRGSVKWSINPAQWKIPVAQVQFIYRLHFFLTQYYTFLGKCEDNETLSRNHPITEFLRLQKSMLENFSQVT